MNNVNFLAYLPDPFEIGNPRFVTCNQAENFSVLSTEQLIAHDGYLVTYDACGVVDALRRAQKSLPPHLVDIGDALKLRSGLARDQGGEREWDVWRALKPFFEKETDGETVSAIVQTLIKQPDEQESLRLLNAACHALKGLWEELLQDLVTLGEIERFQKIEVPIQQIFWNRQYKGIQLDTAYAERFMESVKNEKYTAFREVAEILGISPSGLNFYNVGEFLPKTDAHFLAEFSEISSLYEYFRIAQHSSNFARAFLQYSRASQDLSILKRICGGAERTFPMFHPFGTVTGRILVSDPRLQELRRKYRSILTADNHHRLVYLDYSQFEPGILASLAEDDVFIDRYNESDLYTALSHVLFGNENERSLCKRLFLGFCYGMKRENIAKLLAGADATNEKLSEYDTKVKHFFNAFPKLDEYKLTLESKLLQDGYITSAFGNRRRRSSSGKLSQKERRWAVSQMVQGTASLIFKEALIGLAAEFGNDSILLPMHDAVLLQFEDDDDEKVRHAQETAIHIMKEAFAKWTKKVTPKVIAASFSGEST